MLLSSVIGTTDKITLGFSPMLLSSVIGTTDIITLGFSPMLYQ
jgi:hypothetical protein